MKAAISKLSEEVINRIAAGEVVENPASIVKELIENSIDAGSRRISVEIEGGGLQSIRVVDDGCGMGFDDALACLERHATSKIRSFEDLSNLATMGFRGEALAAIAAVSHFEMATSDQRAATRVVADGGRLVCREPCARNQGTTISVRSLFFNVPARKKFQKSASANASQVRRTVESLALAHPEIAFSLHSQGKKILDAVQSSAEKRIEEVLGTFEQEIRFEEGDVVIWGVAAAPDKTLANRSGQHLFINRRAVFSPLLSKAAKEGYATRIDASSHPLFVLFLDIPPDQVDVNVHPQKKEVRFQNDARIFRQVQEAVSSSFASMPESVPPFSFQESSSSFPPSLPWEAPELSFIKRQEPKMEESHLDFVYPEQPLALCGHYLLLQRETLLLVDLKALHARLLYESMSAEKHASQALMWPLTIEIQSDGDQYEKALNEIGIECRKIGERTLAVDALPPFLDPSDFPDFFKLWEEGKEIGVAASRFCRVLKRQYTFIEAQSMWRELKKSNDRRYDPTGNPIAIEIDAEDFERLMAKKR